MTPAPITPEPRAFVSALQAGDPDRAIAIAQAMLADATPLRAQWQGVARFAAQEEEWPVALAAMARYVEDEPQSVDRRLAHAAMQADAGRVHEAIAAIAPVAAARPNDAGVRHFLGVSLIEVGRRDEGVDHLRAAARLRPGSGQTWLALANALHFAVADTDWAALNAVADAMTRAPADDRAAWLYARGKAWDDLGEYDRAFADFAAGAAIVARERPYYAAADRRDALAQLDVQRRLTGTPSAGSRAIFVTGKPRSGTTLIDSILQGHSAVTGGGELNLMPLAVDRAGRRRAPIAAARERYDRLLRLRFGDRGRIVDKSLNTSRCAGWLQAALPDAALIWVERDPLDTAWSSFRTYFNRGLGWSFDLEAMAHYHALEDRLRTDWRAAYGPGLLSLRYTDLIDDPTATIDRLIAHVGLPPEPGVHRFHEQARVVRTASVSQVRQPINRAGLGSAATYRAHLTPYERAYDAARRALGLS